MYIGGAGEDGTGPGVAVQVQQKAAVLEGGSSEIQPGQIGKQLPHDLPGLPEPLLFKLGVVIGPQPLLFAGGQTKMVDQIVQGGIGQHPLACQRFGKGRPLHAGQAGESRYRQTLGLKQVAQILTEQLHVAHLCHTGNCHYV